MAIWYIDKGSGHETSGMHVGCAAAAPFRPRFPRLRKYSLLLQNIQGDIYVQMNRPWIGWVGDCCLMLVKCVDCEAASELLSDSMDVCERRLGNAAEEARVN